MSDEKNEPLRLGTGIDQSRLNAASASVVLGVRPPPKSPTPPPVDAEVKGSVKPKDVKS